MITDCFLWLDDDNGFKRYYVDGIGVSALSSRTMAVLSKDVDSDGSIEVPTEEFLPNINPESNASFIARTNNLGPSLINWVRVTENSAETVERHLILSQYGYSFKFSTEWLGNVSVINDSQNGLLTFWSVENEDGVPQKSKKLFSIMTVTEMDLDTIGSIAFSYSQITELKGKFYYSKIYDAGVEFGITKKEIKQRVIAG